MPTKETTKLTVKYVLLGVLVALICRKIVIGKTAMDHVEGCKDQVQFEAMISDSAFSQVAGRLSETDPSLVVIQNQHAINMTFNWLCNTVSMPGVHESTVVVTLDAESESLIRRHWPRVTVLPWPVSCLKDAFNYGDGRYQLFYLFRSNLARALLHLGKPFWMIQQDTFWRRDLLSLRVEQGQTDADIIFDRASESEDETVNSIIAGGYYFARPTCAAKAYFKQLSHDLESFYAPDNAYMTYLCSNPGLAKCGHVPFSVITNWIWLHEPSRLSDPSRIPYLIQFDGDTQLGGKLAKLKSLGFYFVKEDGVTCNESALPLAQEGVNNRNKQDLEKTSAVKAYSHLQFGLYQWFIDQFYRTPITRLVMQKFIFPYAHYFMITI